MSMSTFTSLPRTVLCCSLTGSLMAFLAISAPAGEGQDALPPLVTRKYPKIAPFRDELLNRVTAGTPDERRKYAELLPLRILVAYGEGAKEDPEFAVKFLKETLDYIEKNNVVEAADILEPSLKLNNALLSYDERIPRLWLKLKTHGMSDERKAEFLAGLLAPGVDNEAWKLVWQEYSQLGATGKKPLLRMLETIEADMGSRDVLKAVQVGKLLLSKDIAPTEEEFAVLRKRGNLYIKSVLFCCLAMQGKQEAAALLQEVWEAAPLNHTSKARELANGFYLANLNDVAPLILWMLKQLDREERTLAISAQSILHLSCELSQLRKNVIFGAINAGAKGQSRELRQYLQEYVKRPLELKHGMDSEDLMVFYEEYSARGLARELLDDWWKGPR